MESQRTEGIVEEMKERFQLWCQDHMQVPSNLHPFCWELFQAGAGALKDTLCTRGIVRPDYSNV